MSKSAPSAAMTTLHQRACARALPDIPMAPIVCSMLPTELPVIYLLMIVKSMFHSQGL